MWRFALIGSFGNVKAIDGDRAGAGRDDTADDIHCGGFSRTVRP